MIVLLLHASFAAYRRLADSFENPICIRMGFKLQISNSCQLSSSSLRQSLPIRTAMQRSHRDKSIKTRGDGDINGARSLSNLPKVKPSNGSGEKHVKNGIPSEKSIVGGTHKVNGVGHENKSKKGRQEAEKEDVAGKHEEGGEEQPKGNGGEYEDDGNDEIDDDDDDLDNVLDDDDDDDDNDMPDDNEEELEDEDGKSRRDEYQQAGGNRYLILPRKEWARILDRINLR